MYFRSFNIENLIRIRVLYFYSMILIFPLIGQIYSQSFNTGKILFPNKESIILYENDRYEEIFKSVHILRDVHWINYENSIYALFYESGFSFIIDINLKSSSIDTLFKIEGKYTQFSISNSKAYVVIGNINYLKCFDLNEQAVISSFETVGGLRIYINDSPWSVNDDLLLVNLRGEIKDSGPEAQVFYWNIKTDKLIPFEYKAFWASWNYYDNSILFAYGNELFKVDIKNKNKEKIVDIGQSSLWFNKIPIEFFKRKYHNSVIVVYLVWKFTLLDYEYYYFDLQNNTTSELRTDAPFYRGVSWR
jgi:hypothetical protein